MKRLVSATLALTLLGATAAVAEPYGRGGQDYDGAYSRNGYYGGYDNGYRDRDNSGAFVAGVGFLTLAAILASQHRHHHYHSGWYSRGYDRDYDRYDNGFNRGERYGGYGGGGYRW